MKNQIMTLLTAPDTQLEPVAMEGDIVVSEGILGFRLPLFLRSFYKNIGNGGYIAGGFHMYGVQGGYDCDGKYIHDLYKLVMEDIFRDPGEENPILYLYRGAIISNWPERLVPVGLWGPAVDTFSLYLDCTNDVLSVYFFDVSGLDPSNKSLPGPITLLYDSFADFLSALQKDQETGQEETYQHTVARIEADRAVVWAEDFKRDNFSRILRVDHKHGEFRFSTLSVAESDEALKQSLENAFKDPFSE